jgi:heat shock protein HslJ
MREVKGNLDGVWRMIAYRAHGTSSELVEPGSPTRLTVHDMEFQFYAGCNSINCTYERLGTNTLSPSSSFETAMACTPAQQQIEAILRMFTGSSQSKV